MNVVLIVEHKMVCHPVVTECLECSPVFDTKVLVYFDFFCTDFKFSSFSNCSSIYRNLAVALHRKLSTSVYNCPCVYIHIT